MEILESKYDVSDEKRLTSARLQLLMRNFAELYDDTLLLEVSNGATSLATDTLTACYGAFAYQQAFKDVVVRTVNLGGDTDSTGSIVGGMSAALHGWNNLPNDFEEVQGIGEIKELSKELAQLNVQ
jgi:ADP-ribosylglycohydrolase